MAAGVLLVRQYGFNALLTSADKLAYLGGLVVFANRWACKRRGVSPSEKKRDPEQTCVIGLGYRRKGRRASRGVAFWKGRNQASGR
ncbi:hypothetical protein Ahu01nite_099630 [Winogradskya humida]|uniref:Uncharacterized protein n=1 Tax=Winogradskya humida TaxID=113566 RepID=A0ABQ4A7M1_9ACTN|nr:hypothetical protein Ahu01nite_099630 [Actinoplanes humidus]